MGYLYFLNTVGTFIGALVLGYLAFHIFGLKTIYLMSLGILFGLGVYFLNFRWALQGPLWILFILSLVLPFPRKYHESWAL